MSPVMSPKSLVLVSLMAMGSALPLTGCVAASGYTQSEQEIAETLTGSRFQPAPRTERDNIETQDLLAQAAFWSREHTLNPADLESAIKLAAVVRKMGNPGRAIEITRTARVLHRDDPYLVAELAAALIAANQSQGAIEPLDEALQKTPGYARLWSLKGAALDQMEEYDLARKHYNRALQITPYNPNVMANMGLSHALSGDLTTAESWLRRASKTPGAGPSVQQNLAIVLQLQGKDEAEALAKPAQREAALSRPTPPRASVPAPRSAPAPHPQYAPSQYHGPQYRGPQSLRPSSPRSSSYGQPQHYTQPQYTQPQYTQRQAPTAPPSGVTRSPEPTSQPLSSNVREPRVYGGTSALTFASPVRSAPTAPSQQPHSSGYVPAPQTLRGARSPVATAPITQSSSAKTASDVARLAAQSQTRRRVTAPAAGPTQEQRALLQQLAQNVGPKSTNLAAQPRVQGGYPAPTLSRTPGQATSAYGDVNRSPYGTPYTSAPYGAQEQPEYQNQVPSQAPRGAVRYRQ